MDSPPHHASIARYAYGDVEPLPVGDVLDLLNGVSYLIISLSRSRAREPVSLSSEPAALMASSAWYPSDAFSAQWELAHDGLAVMLGLFGLVYRYGEPGACARVHGA